MEKHLLSLLLLSLLLSSCTDWREGSGVLYGNYATLRGEYQRASLVYLELLSQPIQNEAWIKYNLGNVYQFLGESNAALALWLEVQDTVSPELNFRLAFNKGYIYFQKGQYQEAFESFKKALTLQPANKDAKHNLELTLAKIQALSSNPVVSPSRVAPSARSEGTTQQEARAMLDYIRRLEGEKWKEKMTVPTESVPMDW